MHQLKSCFQCLLLLCAFCIVFSVNGSESEDSYDLQDAPSLSSSPSSTFATSIDLAVEPNTDRHFFTLHDTSGDIRIDQLLSTDSASDITAQWQHHSYDVSRGVLPHPVWMRVMVTNSSDTQVNYLLEHTDPGPLSIDAYVVRLDGTIESELHFHRESAYDLRPYPNPAPVFPIQVKQGEQRVVYARIQTAVGGLFSQFAIWTPHDFIAYETRETALYGGVYTAFLLFSFISLIIFFVLRDRTFLSYAGLTFASCMSLINLEAHWVPLIQPEGALVNNAIVWTGIYIFAAFAFVRDYLQLNHVMPWASKLVLGLMGIGPVISLLGLLGFRDAASILMMSSMGVIMFVPFLSLYLWLAKGRNVRLFTCAWFIYCSAILIQFALRQIGVVPHQPFTIYTGAMGAMIEMSLLAASMAYKLLDLKRERDAVREAHVKHLESFSEKLASQVAEKTKALEEAREKAEQEARTDPLTKLFNRRAFNEMVPRGIKTALRDGFMSSIILVDIDHFKSINDNFGHDVGDIVLQRVADAMATVVRENDVLARVGGEEFAIFASTEDASGAQHFCERIRQAVEKLTIHLEGNIELTTTISIGLYVNSQPENISAMLQKADTALYQSKESGRNKITYWQG